MSGDWIKMRQNLGTDPDVIDIASKISIDEFGVVGRLHAVWSWLDQHSADGTNVRITSAFLDRLTACLGFADAMRAIGWLDGRDGVLTFPGYTKHNGETAKSRASEAKRKAEYRNGRDKSPDSSGTNVPQKTGLEKRREEKIDKTPKPPTERDALRARLGGWFKRKETTIWSEKELRAFSKFTPAPDQLALLEWYYSMPEMDHEDLKWRRKDIFTFLNNWPGEVDRALALEMKIKGKPLPSEKVGRWKADADEIVFQLTDRPWCEATKAELRKLKPSIDEHTAVARPWLAERLTPEQQQRLAEAWKGAA